MRQPGSRLRTFHSLRVGYGPNVLMLEEEEDAMKQSDLFRENAENCQHLAERAADHPTYLRYKRMEEAWRSLAEAQDWLDGETSPTAIAVT